MRRLVLALIPVMLLACEEEPPTSEQAAVRLEVSSSYKAGCIAVQARDKAATQNSSMTRFAMRDRGNKDLVVAVFRQDGWSDTLQVITTAHEPHETDSDGEEACAGREVVRDEQEFTFEKAGVVEGRVALEATDDDGDGYVPTANNGTDCDDRTAARFPGNPEICDDFDNDCDDAVNEGLNRTWYRDGDGDGALAEGTGVTACAAPDSTYREAANQTAFDCNDADPDLAPGKPELCDGKDNNCERGADESFPTKGQACSNDICTGTVVCNAEKTAVVCGAPAPVSYHPDEDRDGQGAAGSAGTKVCAPNTGPVGTAANATDCDDVDPGARSGLAEACDAVDNNCNEQVDEGISCGGTLKRVADGNLGGLGHDWRTVAVGPGGQPVWIAGLNGKLVRRGPVGGFQSHSFGDTPANTTNCGDFDWYAAWVRPSDGSVFLAGEGGRVAQHNGAACINQADASGMGHATGIIGFESGGETTLYLVSTEGRLFTWAPGSDPVEQDNSASVYNGIHALEPNLLLVAAEVGLGRQGITSYVDGNLSGQTAHTMSNTVTGNINAVWMGTSNLAYAVGDAGAVWRWNGGTSWTLLPAPPGVTESLFSVVTLPSGDAYTVDSHTNGQLHRRTQHGWARGPKLPAADKPLFGIAMSSAGDFWVVGNDGYVFHYPEP